MLLNINYSMRSFRVIKYISAVRRALMIAGTACGLLLTAISAMGSGYEARSFYYPKYEGYRLDWCLEWGNKCGSPAANVWCRQEHYDRAIDWKKADNIGTTSPTKVIRVGRICSQSHCDSFEWISCERFSDKLSSVKACLNIGN